MYQRNRSFSDVFHNLNRVQLHLNFNRNKEWQSLRDLKSQIDVLYIFRIGPEDTQILTKFQLEYIAQGGPYEKDQLAATLLQSKIPIKCRRKIWWQLCKKPDGFDYWNSRDESPCSKEITKDLHRTANGSLTMEIQKFQGLLKNLLFAYSNYNPKIGYTQGMNYIAGILVLLFDEEQDAFWAFVHIMKDNEDLFMDKLPGLRPRLEVLEQLIKKYIPKLLIHLEKLQIGDLQICFSQYYLTMMFQKTPLKLARLIFEQYLIWGYDFIHRLIFNMIKVNYERLLSMTDFGEINNFLRDDIVTQYYIEMHKQRKSENIVNYFQNNDLFRPAIKKVVTTRKDDFKTKIKAFIKFQGFMKKKK